jgi:hypothetical protein
MVVMESRPFLVDPGEELPDIDTTVAHSARVPC